MATEQEIVRAIHSLFTETNPKATALNSLNAVVQQLESKLGQDLTHKTDFIRAQIHLLFQPPPQQRTGNDHFAPQLSAYLPETPPAVISFSAQPSAPDKADASEPNKPPKDSVQTKAKRRGGPGGLNKLCGVSPELQAVVGHPALPRTEIVKQLWAYIRKNNLQDPSNKRKIVCNEELRLVFETDCTDMFKMNKLLAKHIIPLEPTKQPANKKKKADVVTRIRSAETGPYVVISDALVDLFGVSEKEMLQAEVLRRIWEYIKVNNLEDPLNPMVILCDAKLQDLFGCETITALGIPELLARHITRR